MRIPFTSSFNALVKSLSVRSTDVESFLSYWEMISNIVAQSVTFFASGPIWSRDEPYATRPYLDTLPYVGLIPVTPQNAAG